MNNLIHKFLIFWFLLSLAFSQFSSSMKTARMYELKKDVYNPITNNVPKKIKNQKDLELKESDKQNLSKLLQDKMNERKNIKCDKKKKVSQENTYGIRQNTFNQLKDTHKKLDSKRQKKKKNKGNVLQSLKDLGILN